MENTTSNVIFITPKLQLYRVPILRRIVRNSSINLTVAHSGKRLLDEVPEISEIVITEKPVSKFFVHQDDIVELCNDFDVAVVMMYIQRLSFMKLMFSRRRRFKLIYWGIGVKASISSPYDSPSPLNHIRTFAANKSDASIFYTEYARQKHLKRGVDKNKLFVMPNTVEVLDADVTCCQRDCFLFVGALYKQKKIFELLRAYHEAFLEDESILPLVIIGGGEEFEPIRRWVSEKGLSKNISLKGPIYEESVLSEYFLRAVATISPGQAGLSVLKSMGYGVPFVTIHNAVTGGERLSIKHNVNGILFKDNSELKGLILDMSQNKGRYIEMGLAAKKFYDEYRSPNQMAQGFIDAVEYVTTIN